MPWDPNNKLVNSDRIDNLIFASDQSGNLNSILVVMVLTIPNRILNVKGKQKKIV